MVTIQQKRLLILDNQLTTSSPPLPPPSYDSEASLYITAVETADGQELEVGVKDAINDFVVGCKTDPSPIPGVSNYEAIKACCILAGARTLSGALVPLIGTAPTNFNFVSADYNRETGLKGDGISKYLDSNYNNSSQDNSSASVFISEPGTTTREIFLGAGDSQSGATNLGRMQTSLHTQTFLRTRSVTNLLAGTMFAGSFAGVSRSTSSSYNLRHNNGSTTINHVAQTPYPFTFYVFAANVNSIPEKRSSGRIIAYFIGEAVDLALLDTRATVLMTAINSAIL